MRGSVLAGAFALAALVPGDVIIPKEGDLAPDFEGTWMSYEGTSLSDLRGKLVFIEFWRTW